MRFLIGVPFVLAPSSGAPPAWASAGLLLLAVIAMAVMLRLTRPRRALMGSGEAARRRLGLAGRPAQPRIG